MHECFDSKTSYLEPTQRTFVYYIALESRFFGPKSGAQHFGNGDHIYIYTLFVKQVAEAHCRDSREMRSTFQQFGLRPPSGYPVNPVNQLFKHSGINDTAEPQK